MTTSYVQSDYMRVGVRELKARLSEYLDRAEAGETVIVTERGRAKVEIRPLSLEHKLEQAAREGRVTPGRHGRPPMPRRRFKSRLTLEELLREDRGE